MAELADALDLGSSSFTGVQVQLLSSPLDFKGFSDSSASLTEGVLPWVLPTVAQSKSAVEIHW